MHHEMLTQRAPFCIGAMAKNGTLSQHFVTHVIPPLDASHHCRFHRRGQPAKQRKYLSPHCSGVIGGDVHLHTLNHRLAV